MGRLRPMVVLSALATACMVMLTRMLVVAAVILVVGLVD